MGAYQVTFDPTTAVPEDQFDPTSAVPEPAPSTRDVIKAAVRFNPDQAAQADQLSRKYPLEPNTLLRNLQNVQLQEIVDKYDQTLQTSPKLSRYMREKPWLAAQAHDDLEPLKGVESSFAALAAAGAAQAVLGISESIWRTPDAAQRMVGYLASLPEMAGLPWYLNPIRGVQDVIRFVSEGRIPGVERRIGGTTDIANRVAGAMDILTEDRATFGDAFGDLSVLSQNADQALRTAVETGRVEQLGRVLTDPNYWAAFLGQAAPSLYAAIKSGGSLAFMGWLEGMEQASSAADFEARTGVKVTDAEFAQATMQTAMINAVLEKAGLDRVLGAQGKGLKGVVKAMLGEGGTEALQQVNTNLAALLAYDEGRELLEGVVSSFMGGVGAGGGAATAAAAAGKAQEIIDRRQRQSQDAVANADKLAAAMQAAAQSKLRERNPDTFKELVQRMAAETDGAPASVYIDAQVLAQSGVDVAQVFPSAAAQMDEALASNGAVEIAIEEVLTSVPGTPLEQVFLQNVRLSPDALSLAEVQQAEAQAREFLQLEADRVMQQAADTQAWQASSETVKQAILDQLNQAGRFTPDVNEAYATLQANFFSSMAARLGITPAELYDRYQLKVAAKSPGGQVLNSGRKLGEVEVEAFHYSRAPRPVVSTRAFGTGLQGSGREMYMNAEDRRLRHRAYFYVDKGTGINPEAGVGGIAHKTRLRNIYDSNADPLRLKQGRDQLAFESAVLDAGFDGYLDRLEGTQSGQVILLGDRGVKMEVLGPMGATRGEVVPGPQRAPAQGRDIVVEALQANRDLPMGEMSLSTWSMLLAKRMPEVHAEMAAAGVFDGDERVYKDGLIKRFIERTEAPVYGQAAVERLTPMAERGERIVGTRAVISPGEKEAIKESAEKVGISVAEITRAVREHKLAHPPAQGWAPLVYVRTVVDDGKVIHEYRKTPYDFNTDKEGKSLTPGTSEYRRRVNAIAKSMAEEVRRVLRRAQAGDKNAQNILAQASWYKAMRRRLRQEFGGLGDLFADLLGATSPNTAVRDNWANAVEALRRATRGDYDQLIPQWEAWADRVDELELDFRAWFNERLAEGLTKKAIKALPEYKAKLDALKEARTLPDNLLPLKESGKKYGFNGRNIARAMVDLWRVVKNADPDIGRGGTAPKALNFSGNLIGFRERATIDVWAARMLQRLAGGLRIPSMAETGVSGEMREDGTTTLQFGFGQDVFSAAVERIRNDPELRTDKTLAEINDDDLQAVVWFVEKEIWTVNNWTNAAGEGGSFEVEANLTGTSQQDRVRELRRVIDSSKSTPEQKAAARAELAALERTVDRFVGGLSIQMSADTQGVDFVPTDADMARLANEVRTAIYEADDGNTVLGSKALSTEGRYGGVERSLDLEVIAREGYDANHLWLEMLRQAQAARQDAVFLSRVLREDEEVDPLRHRPGVEIYFRDAAAAERLEEVLAELAREGVEFFTVIVDGRRLSEAVAGAMPPAVGVRLQYVPEFEQRYGMDDLSGLDDVALADKIQKKAEELRELAARVSASVDGVSFARQFWYDTQVAFSAEYQEKIDALTAGTVEGESAPAGSEVWAGQSIRAGIESANRQLREAAGGESRADVLGGDAPAQTGERGGGYSGGTLAPLEGAPIIEGATGPDPRLVAVAEQYARDNGIDLKRQAVYVDVDPERARRIAAAYEAMPHTPQDPAVKEAYENLIRQTLAQYRALEATGYRFYFYDETNDPYAGNPWNAMRDLRANQVMGVFATEAGFGSGATDLNVEDNPLLADTGITWPYGSLDGPPKRVLANDLFRAVHDAFGHGLEGAGFRARGEENAWQAHVRLFTGSAVAAITTETRGQNSWLNYGPYGERNRTAKVEDTIFADQKTGLMPEWTWTEGRAADMPDQVLEQGPRPELPETIEVDGVQRPTRNSAGQPIHHTEEGIRNFWRWFGDSKAVDEQGRPLVVYHGTRADFSEFDTDRIGQNFAESKGGFFFTGSQAAASAYASMRGGEGGNVMPAYLSLQNPLTLDTYLWATGDTVESALTGREYKLIDLFDEDPAGVIAYAKDGGHDGIFWKNGKDVLAVAFDPAQIKSATGNRGTFDPANASILEQGPRGTFNPERLLITLNENADLSTFLHESGHFFLEVLADLASQPDAPQQIKDDMAATLKWFGVPDLETWNSYTLEQKRPYHERWAEAFEQYLFEGKAPSQELQPLFRRFRSWLVNVYKSLKQFMQGRNLQLGDDIRKVFDRMIATDEEIAQAEEAAGMLPDFEATNEAIEKLQARSLRDLKWAVNARNKTIKALQKQAAKLRKEVEAEVRAEVEQQPVYRTIRWLKKGETVDPTTGDLVKAEKGFRLNTDALAEMYPESTLARPDLTRLRGMTAKNGLHPDLVADMFGFASGDALVRAIIDAAPINEVVEGMTEQRMLERHGDLVDQRAIEEAANEAVHNEVRARALATELKAQTEMLNPRQATGRTASNGRPITVNALTEAAKQFAQNLAARRRVKDLRSAAHQHRAAEARAAKRWQQATAKGDTQAAVQAKRDQLLNNYTVKALQDAQAEVKKIQEFFRKVTKGNNEKIVERRRDPDVVNAMRAILAAYGVAQRLEKSALEYMEVVAKNDPAMYAALKPSVDAAVVNAKPLNELTMEELRGLYDELRAMWELAKRSRQMEVDGNLLDIEDAADELVKRMDEIGVPATVPGERGAITDREEAGIQLQYAKAILSRVEQWAERMDGKFGGPFLRLVFQPIKEAADRYRTARVEYRKRFTALVENIAPILTPGPIHAPELNYTFGNARDSGQAELLHAILHTGNESNKRKLLLGRGWATELEDGTLDTSRWDAFIARMINEGKITKAHYDFAQGVWDLLEEMKPLAQETHRKVFGRYFAEVTATPFSTPFGTYRGGYVPAQTDARIVKDAKLRELAEAENESMAYAFPASPSGFTKSRVEYNKPLLLDLRALAQHMDKVLLFSYMQGPVTDVRRLLTNKRVSYALDRIDHGAYEAMLLPWLNRAAKQIVETPVAGDRKLSRFLSAARSRAGMALMFANLSNTVQQITGFSLAAVKVKPSLMMKATASFIAEPKAMKERVATASEYMRNRMLNEAAAMNDAVEQILVNATKLEKAKDWVQHHAYFLQVAVDNTMSPIIWTAAYNQAIEQKMSHKDAVRFADGVIRQTQGTSLPEDISRFESGPAYARLFTQFIGYFNMMANTNATVMKQIADEMGLRKGAGKLLYVALAGLLVPIWVAEAIAQAFRGGPDDEDDDGYLDDWLMAVFGLGTLRGMVAQVPIVGQLAQLAVNRFNDNPADDKFSLSPAVSLIESAVSSPASVYMAIVEEGSAQKAVRDVAAAATLITGLPIYTAARPAGYLAGMADGRIEPTGPVDLARGLVTGVASPESKAP